MIFKSIPIKLKPNSALNFWFFFILIWSLTLQIGNASNSTDLEKARNLLSQARTILKSDPEQGIIWLKEAQFIFKSNGDIENEINCILTLAEIHLRLSDYDISYSLLTNAASMAMEHNLNQQLLLALTSLGRVSAYMDEVERALSFVSDGVELAKDNNFEKEAQYLEAFGAYIKIYYKKDYQIQNLKKIQGLVNYLDKNSVKDTLMLMPAYNLYAGALFYVGKNPDLASIYYQKSIALAEKTGDKFRYSLTSNNYGEMLTIVGNLDEAEQIFRQSFEKAREVKSKLLTYNGYKHLSFCAEAKGDFEMALHLYKQYETLKNEVLNETLIRKTRQVHSLYQLERKGRENDRIKAEQALNQKESESAIRFYQYVAIFIFVILVFLILLYIINRKRLTESISQGTVISEQNAKLQELNTDLYKQRKTAEKAKLEAENAIKSKIDFLSIITHEIRTPLNAVIGTVQLLQEENPYPHQKRSLEILKFSAENLLNLINDILDYNKIEAQKVELERKPFNLAVLLKNISNSLQMRADEKGVEIRLRLDKKLPPAFLGDRLRMGQVFYNLISNAIKFTEKGQVEIEVRYYQNNPINNLTISVKDTGIGIPEDKIKGIFDFFSQADSSITRKFGGSGLGLSITKNLLSMMGTTIQIESEYGKGSKFFFSMHLPVSFEETNEVAELTEIPDNEVVSGKILFVEDVDFNRVVAERFFKKWKLNFETAENGHQAISLASQKSYKLILLDLQLPDMNGFSVASSIREKGPNQTTPILAMTAANYSEVKEQMETVGINGFVPKPFVAAELKNAIFHWLKGKATVEANPK